MDNKMIKDILIYLFEEMNSQNFDYCILKNYQDLPETVNAQDVDILINSKSMKKIKKILNKVKQQFHIKAVIFSRKGNINRFELLKYVNSHDTFLIIEFWTGVDWYCFPMFSNKDIFKKKMKYRYFYIAPSVFEILICWLVPFMFGGEMKDRYLEMFFNVYKDNKKEIETELSKTFGGNLTQKIIKRLDNGDIHIYDLLNEMRFHVLISSFIRFKLIPFKYFLRLAFDKIYIYLNKYPVNISF